MQTSNASIEFGKIVNEFLLLVQKCIQHYYKPDISEGYQKYDKRELQLMDEFLKIKSEINTTLCNTIDMKFIGKKMCQIIDLGEKYIKEMKEENEIPNCLLLRNIAAYMISLLNTIPKDIDNDYSIDFSNSSSTFACELIMPYVSALTVFRKTISELAEQRNVNDIIKECDRIRDKVLPELGIILNEANPEKSVLIDANALKQWGMPGEVIIDKVRQSHRSSALASRRKHDAVKSIKNISIAGNSQKKLWRNK